MSKVVIVTGASRGLGYAIAQVLLKEQHKVFLVARSEDELRKLKAEHGDAVDYLCGDLADFKVSANVVAAAVKTFGRIDGVIVNHGTISPLTKICDADVEAWRRAYDINMFSTLALVKESIPELRKTNGRVICVSTGASVYAFMGWAAYGSSKAAMNHFCAHMAVEEPSITTVAISPGKVDTDMQKQIREEGNAAMSAEDHASFVNEHETGLLLQPIQPGTVIAKLAIDAPRSLNGKHYRWNSEELAGFQM